MIMEQFLSREPTTGLRPRLRPGEAQELSV
jgi:hypothetical protein